MTKYQKIPEFVEAFQMNEGARSNVKSWPEWAIAAQSKDSRQIGSIFLTNPENAEGTFSIRTEYDVFEIPENFWLVQLASGSFMLMQDELFKAGFILADEEAKSSTGTKTTTSQKKAEQAGTN
jgi:hypothetical protein